MLNKSISYPCRNSSLRKDNLNYPEVKGFEVYLTQHKGVRFPKMHLQAATCFLDFLAASGKQIISVHQKDIDDFITEQGTHYQRKTTAAITSYIRSFFRYLFFAGILKRDFSESIHSPRVFKGERDPRYLRPWQVKQILSVARENNTVIGKRDYAILMLLAIYGLRGSEISNLRLDDLHWKTRQLTIHNRKCGDTLVLPMVAQVGQALADYLCVRRDSVFREIFLSTLEPFHPLKQASLKNLVIRAGARCGINIAHPGAQTFRFSNAQSLFQAQRPISEIAGILGHSNLGTTLGYLSFAIHPLYEVAINDGEDMS
jgi:site-specific recombinase XerD